MTHRTLVGCILLLIPFGFAYAGSVRFSASSEARNPHRSMVVCTFPALSLENPLDQFFFSPHLICFPGETIVDGPLGVSNYFAQEGPLVNGTPGLLIDRRDPKSAQKVLNVRIPLVPGAELLIDEVPRAEGSWIVAYCLASDHGGNQAILSQDGRRIAVPSETDVVTFVVRESQPVEMFRPIKLHSGERKRPSPYPAGGRQVAAAIAYPRDTPKRITPPIVELSVGSSKFAPLYTPKSYREAARLLHIFTGTAAGRAKLEISGDYWQHNSIQFNLQEGFNLLDRPLTAEGAGAIKFEGRPSGRVVVKSCDSPATPCKSVRAVGPVELLPALIGGFASGSYQVELISPKTTVTWRDVKLEAWKTTQLRANGTLSLPRFRGQVSGWASTIVHVDAGGWYMELLWLR